MLRLKNYIFVLLLIGCTLQEERQPKVYESEANAFRIAMSSEDYVEVGLYIQNNPETYQLDSAIKTYHSLYRPEGRFQCEPGAIVFIDSLNLVEFEGEYVSPSQLKKRTFDFLMNPENGIQTVRLTSIDSNAELSSGLILIADETSETDSISFRNALIQITEGVKLYAKYLARTWYLSDYKNLPENQRTELHNALGLRIGFPVLIELDEAIEYDAASLNY